MTERLYEADPYLREFDARVLDCRPSAKGWETVLDRSAFYPEGGGQPGDRGTLSGVPVTDTRESGGETVHFCAAPLTTGADVQGVLDWDRRFDHMQQHSGEHIVSGLICSAFSCDNVGFHMGAETVVIDFNHPIPPEALKDIEARANRVIWENRPFLVTHPSPEELAVLPYRSKKALSGDVRLVECPGADLCACCGTHVRSAGELGLIQLLSLRPFREGVRIEMVSGKRAYAYARQSAEQNRQVSVLTSAKQAETAAAVERLLAELSEARYRLVGAENRLFHRLAEELAGQKEILLFQADLSPDALRRCCEALSAACPGRCAVFTPAEGGGCRYAIASAAADLRPLAKAMSEALGGRGGGKPGFIQGSVTGDEAAVRAFFDEYSV